MANNIYYNEETSKVFKSSGGDVVLTLTSLAAGAGRVSAQLDLGTAPRSLRYRWVMTTKQGSGTIVIGDTCADIYVSTSDGTFQDGTPGTSDAALSSVEKARNMQWIGACVNEATAAAVVVSSGIIELPNRYVSVVVINRQTTITLSATATDHQFILTPIPDQIQ